MHHSFVIFKNILQIFDDLVAQMVDLVRKKTSTPRSYFRLKFYKLIGGVMYIQLTICNAKVENPK